MLYNNYIRSMNSFSMLEIGARYDRKQLNHLRDLAFLPACLPVAPVVIYDI